MALVTAACVWVEPGFSVTITYDDTTELIDHLTVTNPTNVAFTLGFVVGNRSGTRTVAAQTPATVVSPPGRAPRSTDNVQIWVV